MQALRAEISLADAAGPQLSLVSRRTLRRATQEIQEGGVDCVVLDLGLPDASGLEALRQVQHADSALPVVVLSAEESEALAVQAVQEGAQDFVLKTNATGPVLLRAIHYACQRKRRELELPARPSAITSPACRIASASWTAWPGGWPARSAPAT